MVRLNLNTISRLAEHGAFGESYDAVINKIMDKLKARAK